MYHGGKQSSLTLEECLGAENMWSRIGKDLHQIMAASVIFLDIPQSKGTGDNSLLFSRIGLRTWSSHQASQSRAVSPQT